MDKKRFIQLLDALNGGWEIEEPVILGAIWHTATNKIGAYHFVLRNKLEKTTLISLPPSPQLLVFLSENKINVSAINS